MTKTNTIILVFAMLGFSQIHAQNVGVGTATPATKLNVVQTAAVTGIEVDHAGTSGNSIVAFPQNAANTSSAVWIFNMSGGRGLNIDMMTAASTSVGARINQTGAADAVDIFQTNATGAGQFISLSSATNAFAGQQINHGGTGFGQWINMTNTGASGTGIFIDQDGTDAFSRGVEVAMDAANTAIGVAAFHSGAGVAVYGQSAGSDGVIGVSAGGAGTYGSSSFATGYGAIGISTGVQSTGGLFQVSNTAADRSSIGAFILYDGTGTTGGGGGNAMEIQHDGTNGNAVDVFIGSPAVAPGPANTTNEYSVISASHMGTGVGVAGFKSAVQASSNGGDPTVFVTNNGTDGGHGVQSQVTPTLDDPIGVYGYAQNNASDGYGVGVQGYGGWYGVHGWEYQSAAVGWNCYGVYATGDLGASGAKTFMIDHPLDPANKVLRHYSIESNEITNMYRGVAQLDANGQAVIALPDYFDAVNKNVSYQLTAIGTATQPYVAVEEANNEFTVAGAPNTKVSWVVYGERNDPTIQYHNISGDYNNEVQVKQGKTAGKYYDPAAYGQPETMGIHYNATDAANRKKAANTKQEAMPKPDFSKKNATTVQPNTKKPAQATGTTPSESSDNVELLNTTEARK